MKGISAIIATVLLVAFVVAIAGIVSVWSTTLTNTQTKTITNQSKGQAVCNPSIIIDQVYVPSSGSSNFINVTYHNAGTQSISAVHVEIRNSSAINTTDAPNLSAGETAYISIGGQSNTTNFIRVRGLCASSIVVSDECYPSDFCWKTG